jgi:hypothetical protein
MATFIMLTRPSHEVMERIRYPAPAPTSRDTSLLA